MSGSQPPAPNPAKDYRESLKVYLKYLPQLLQGEQDARSKYDPQRIEEQMGLQDKYGKRMGEQEVAALKQLDPRWMQNREQLGSAVYDDLAGGYKIPKAFDTELTSQIRGAEAARGNVLGGAPIAAEDLFKGNAMLQLYQQHIQNAGNFLSGSTIPQQLINVHPVTPDRSSQYVNPSAAGQMAQNNYQNQLAQYQASSGSVSPWLQAAEVGGQIAASVYGGPAAGAAAGAGSQYVNRTYFSDTRLKENIVPVGFSHRGFPIFEFNYKDCPGRFRGTIAQAILPVKPSAVTMDKSGFYRVDYSQLDVKLEQIPEHNYAQV